MKSLLRYVLHLNCIFRIDQLSLIHTLSPPVLQFILQMIDALEFCHNKNVIHRDIKPVSSLNADL